MTHFLSDSFRNWLEQQAESLDLAPNEHLLTQLAATGVFRLGVPSDHGGLGATISDAFEAIAEIAEYSLTAAFVCWSQRTFIEYLLTGNHAGLLRERELPALLRGDMAGATGLSNAMKFLSGIEQLQLSCELSEHHWQVSGRLPWITNLRPEGFRVAVMAQTADGESNLILALPHTAPGLSRSPDLELIGLQGGWTAALELNKAEINEEWVLDSDAHSYLPRVRPAFMALQCALPLGLARRSLKVAESKIGQHNVVLQAEIAALQQQLEQLASELRQGLNTGLFLSSPQALFEIKIGLVNLANEAAQLELSAHGGAAYLRGKATGFERRWREQAFLPLITPSSVQLRVQLAQHAAKPQLAVQSA